ncbi:hypothetical protein PR048_024984 [Dryococelus australis]|uniref:Uncharacterized protein n=1 Tax=Dryococelus australis TaxID=614101 RepID=A0ABQ9GQ15_9NEOP|nr:hypothetical protein PR048_024984 [Dryococelus australis]
MYACSSRRSASLQANRMKSKWDTCEAMTILVRRARYNVRLPHTLLRFQQYTRFICVVGNSDVKCFEHQITRVITALVTQISYSAKSRQRKDSKDCTNLAGGEGGGSPSLTLLLGFSSSLLARPLPLEPFYPQGARGGRSERLATCKFSPNRTEASLVPPSLSLCPSSHGARQVQRCKKFSLVARAASYGRCRCLTFYVLGILTPNLKCSHDEEFPQLCGARISKPKPVQHTNWNSLPLGSAIAVLRGMSCNLPTT